MDKDIKIYEGIQYQIPLESRERFDYIVNKINYAKTDMNFIELVRAYSRIFECEFKKYRVK